MASLQHGALYTFDVHFSYLKQVGVTTTNDLQYLAEFYEAVGGGLGLFQFNPAQSNLENTSVVHDITQLQNGFFGTGDGITTTFPLWRSTAALGGGVVTLVEQIQNVTALSGVYVGGVLLSPSLYTQSNFPAVVTFTTPPALGATLAWEGSYNYLVQFSEDTQDFEEFSYQLWSLKSLKLESVNL